VLYCGSCGKAYAIPTAQERARVTKKREDEKHVLMLVGGAVFLIYVMPTLLALGYVCFVFVFYVLVLIGFGVGSAVS